MSVLREVCSFVIQTRMDGDSNQNALIQICIILNLEKTNLSQGVKNEMVWFEIAIFEIYMS